MKRVGPLGVGEACASPDLARQERDTPPQHRRVFKQFTTFSPAITKTKLAAAHGRLTERSATPALGMVQALSSRIVRKHDQFLAELSRAARKEKENTSSLLRKCRGEQEQFRRQLFPRKSGKVWGKRLSPALQRLSRLCFN